MSASLSLPRGGRLRRDGRFFIGQGARNGKLDLSTGVGFTPERQLTTDKLGALLHPWHAVVSGAAARLKYVRVNAVSVVADLHPKPSFVVVEVHLDAFGARVPKCIAQ